MPFRWPWSGPEIPDTDWPTLAGKPPGKAQWKRWAAKSPLRVISRDGSLAWVVGRSAVNRYNALRPVNGDSVGEGPSLLCVMGRWVEWKSTALGSWIQMPIVVPEGVAVVAVALDDEALGFIVGLIEAERKDMELEIVETLLPVYNDVWNEGAAIGPEEVLSGLSMKSLDIVDPDPENLYVRVPYRTPMRFGGHAVIAMPHLDRPPSAELTG